MRTMRLTESEVREILKNRHAVKQEKLNKTFRKETLKLAFEFKIHCDEIHEYPNFNEFINYFNKPHEPQKNKIQYDTILKIYEILEKTYL